MEKQQQQSIAAGIARAHAAFNKDLEKLEQAAGPELLAWLRATRVHLADHFRFEEDHGYMNEALKREPRLERQAQALLAEHQLLVDSLQGLLEEAAGLPKLDDAYRNKVHAWLAEVRNHESKENSLVEDAFNMDLGAED